MNVNEAIEKVGKDTQSVDLYADIPEVKPEDMKLQAVAPVSYVAAVEQSRKDRDKFFKSIEARKEAVKNALENTDESRFKRMNKSTGKSSLNVDQPGLKKMHLDESLFEGVQDEEDGWNTDEISELEHYNVLSKIYNLNYEIDNARRGYYTNATTANELASYVHNLSSDLEQFAYEIQELGDSEPEDLDESKIGGNELLSENTSRTKPIVIRDIETFDKYMKEAEGKDGHYLRYYYKPKKNKFIVDNAGGFITGINAYARDILMQGTPIIIKWRDEPGISPWSFTPAQVGLNDDLTPITESFNKNEFKKPLKEATIITDVKSFRPWGIAVDTYNKVKEEDKLDELERMIEEMYPDGIEAQTFNDLLGYDQDFVYQMLNIKVEEE